MKGILTFTYGVMGAGKSAGLFSLQGDYTRKGFNCLVLKPMCDNRDATKVVASRNGNSLPCKFVEECIFPNNFMKTRTRVENYDAIFVDEAQFCKKEEIETLYKITRELDIPVYTYGLSTDFQNNLFEGSKELFVRADEKTEVPGICWCGCRARMNARFNEDGKVLKSGEQIVTGGDDQYTSLCADHYDKGDIGPKLIEELKFLKNNKSNEKSDEENYER